MGRQIEETMKKVANGSTDFERSNSDLKRRYLVRNIQAFNYIVAEISVGKGSFGTGYPFYVLARDLTGKIPIIDEQIRYNEALIAEAMKSKQEVWICESCLEQNYGNMIDLKHVCKPCPNIENGLKPRKVINRLQDLDMWMVCEDGHLKEAEELLQQLLQRYKIHPSDTEPIQTLRDMTEITEDIKSGIMPVKFLPIDAHIIEYSKIKSLIEQVPAELEKAKRNNQVPYLPIHPRSYRKVWQYDDEAYNFIYDYLSAFTEFNFESELNNSLRQSRNTVVSTYTPDELYTFLVQSATDANKRRNETPELKKAFEQKIQSWKIRTKIQEKPDDWER